MLFGHAKTNIVSCMCTVNTVIYEYGKHSVLWNMSTYHSIIIWSYQCIWSTALVWAVCLFAWWVRIRFHRTIVCSFKLINSQSNCGWRVYGEFMEDVCGIAFGLWNHNRALFQHLSKWLFLWKWRVSGEFISFS